MAKVIFVLIIVGVLLAALIPLIQISSRPYVRDDLKISAANQIVGLANTSWPTVFHDLKRTNRTSALGYQSTPTGTKWRKYLPQRFGGGSLRGATIGTNGRSIYLAAGFNGLYSINKNTGEVEWQRFAETGMGETPCPPALADNEKWIDTGPTIGIDGTLYITSEYGWGMALDPETGATESGLKYKFYLCKTEQAVAIDANSIYAGSWDGKFFAYYINGIYQGTPSNPKDHSSSHRKWTYKFANPGRLYTYGTPAIGDDGTVYFGFKGVYALYPDSKCPGTDPTVSCAAQRKWYAQINRPLESGGAIPYNGVAIGPEGNIYINYGSSLFVIDKNGPVTNPLDTDSQYLWEFVTGGGTRGRAPAIGADGTVYIGSDDGYLYAIDPSSFSESRPKNSEHRPICHGNSTNTSEAWCIKWKFRLGPCQAFSNALVDGSNTIYINTNCDNGNGRLYAINANGSEKWRFNTLVRQGFIHDQQMTMDGDGTLYFNSGQHEFAALAGSGTGPTSTPTPTVDPNATPTRTPTPTITPTRTSTPAPLRSDYLSDQSWISATSGDPNVPVLRDKANNGTPQGGPITLQQIVFNKGIGTHANSEITFAMNGRCSEFHAIVGVDDSADSNGSVVFQVYADTTLLVDTSTTGILRGDSPNRTITITQNMIGKQILRLVVTNAGDNWNFDRADWADARVVCTASAPGDMNGDTIVNISDYNLFLPQIGNTGNGDFNGNNKVDIFDFNIVVSRFGT